MALKKYPELKDIIIFGSFVRGKTKPGDVDMGLLIPKYKTKSGVIGKIIMEFDAFKGIDTEVIDSEMVYMDPLFWRIAKDGFSIKYSKFISKATQTESMTIFEYSLKDLTKTQKVQFNRALHNVLQDKNVHLVKAGSLWVPSMFSEQFQELADSWQLRKKTKRVDAVFLGKASI